MSERGVLAEVAAERKRQDAQWGGPQRDDALPVSTFCQLVEDYAGWARVKAREGSLADARHRLLQAAALAVAAVESLDRRLTGSAEATPGGESLRWE
jgi:hypothetical protein